MKKNFFKFFVIYTIISLVAVNFSFVKVETAKADTVFTIINSCEELQDISDLSGNYRLGNNIDCVATGIFPEEEGYVAELYNSGAGFLPIGLVGTTSSPFTGTFDGNEKRLVI